MRRAITAWRNARSASLLVGGRFGSETNASDAGSSSRRRDAVADADGRGSRRAAGLFNGSGAEPGRRGSPAEVSDVVAAMFEFKTILEELLQQKLTSGAHAGQFAGPRWPTVQLRRVKPGRQMIQTEGMVYSSPRTGTPPTLSASLFRRFVAYESCEFVF